MRGRILGSSALVLAALAAGACGGGATDGTAAVRLEGAEAEAAGAEALTLLHHLNRVSVEMGELAKSRGTDPRVQALGRRLVMDHGFAEDRVVDLADDMAVDLTAEAGVVPTEAGAEEPLGVPREAPFTRGAADASIAALDQQLGELRDAPAGEHDQLFVQALSRMHADLRPTLAQAASSLRGEQVGDLLEDLIPILDQHAMMAHALGASDTLVEEGEFIGGPR